MAYRIIKTEPSLIGEISRPVIMAVLDSDDDLAALGNNYGGQQCGYCCGERRQVVYDERIW